MFSLVPPVLRRFIARRSALVVAALGLGASVSASMWLHRDEDQRQAANFQQAASERLDVIELTVTEMADTLGLLARLYSASGGVNEAQFRFSARLFLEKRPYVLALTYHALGPANVASAPSIEIWTDVSPLHEGKRGILLPVDGTKRQTTIRFSEVRENYAGRTDTVGNWLHEELDDIVRAASATSAAGASLMRRRHAGTHPYVLIVPVHARPSAPNEPTGYASVVFCMPQLVGGSLKRAGFLMDARYGVAVHDDTFAQPGRVVYRHGALPQDDAGTFGWRIMTRELDLMGHALLVKVVQERKAPGTAGIAFWLALVGGLLLSGVVAATIHGHVRHADFLRESNKKLASNIAERERAEEALHRSQHELRALSAHQQQVREEERRRIAREVHDDLGQNLLALRIGLVLLQQDAAGNANAEKHLQELFSQIDRTIKSVRRIINNLRPTVLDLGLRDAIEWQVEQMNRQHAVRFSVVDLGDDVGKGIDDERATSVFRVVQESMTNVIRHAKARSAEIRISQKDGRLSIDISDDGLGIRHRGRKPGSFGLIGMKERVAAMGGHFAMTGLPGGGTTVSVSIPVPAAASVPSPGMPDDIQAATHSTGSLNT